MTGLHVLLLEERPDDAERVVAQLEQAGFDVTAERVDTREGFEAALRPELDVILADYTLPSFTLPVALGLLRESGLSVPLIVVAGSISDETAIKALHGGAADFLVKDRLARLPRAVESAVERRTLRDQRAADEQALRRTMAELSAANEELRRLDEFKDQILTMTSHELRTPLTSILGYTSLLVEAWDDEDRESGRRWAATVERQTRRLIRLVEDLLTLSRLEGDRFELTAEPLPVEEVVAGAIDGLPQRAGVVVEGPRGATVLAEAVRVQQILAGLIDNAFRYGSSPVTLEVEESADTVRFSVVDAGKGVPADFVPSLFEKFTQADPEQATGGLGLGLALSRQLAEALDGTLEHSEDDGGGARFTLTLPRYDDPARWGGLPLMRRADGPHEGSPRP